MGLARIWLCVGLLFLPRICYGQTTQPTTEPTAISGAIDPAAALKAATDRATAKFADTDQGRALAEQVTAAEKQRDDARASGSTDDISAAAMQLLSAKSAYDRALRTELDSDPDMKAATAAQRVAIVKQSEVPTLNQQILDFAIKHVGTQVGDGECWTLADAAMRSANATHPTTYVWGRALRSKDRIFPGDIIQFTTVRLQNGTWWETLGDPNHTAIVREVKSSGVYVILHQNYGKPGKVVLELTINLNTKTAGEFVIYRPGA
jgi:hypothetical protein